MTTDTETLSRAAADRAAAASADPAARAASPWPALPVILTGTLMVVLDFFIVNVGLPSMQRDLHAGTGSIEWIVAGYALTSAVLLITSSRLGDAFGRRLAFCLGIALFTLASAGCGAAASPTALVVARLVQGAGAALILPNVLALIGASFTGPDRARALGAYALVMGLAAVCGQLLGGLLIQADIAGLSWRSVFLINVPVGIAALALAPRLVPESRAPRAGKLDLAGIALATVALTALVLPLVDGRQLGWPAWSWISLAAVPVLALALVAQQRRLARRGGRPLLDPGLLRSPRLRSGLLTQMAFWSGQASFFLVLALYLQQGRGLRPLAAGLVFTVLAVTYVAASGQAPSLLERFGRRVLSGGALALAAGHATLLGAVAAVGVGGSVAWLFPGLALIGAGMGLLIAPLTSTIMAAAGAEHAGSASGALATMQSVGNTLGVAIVGVIFYGALHGGYAAALEWSLAELVALLVCVAGLTRRLPLPPR